MMFKLGGWQLHTPEDVDASARLNSGNAGINDQAMGLLITTGFPKRSNQENQAL